MSNDRLTWIIRTRNRVWILDGKRLLWRLIVLMMLSSSVWLIYDSCAKQRRLEQERARAGEAQNRYRAENARETERGKRIISFAENEFTITTLTLGNSAARFLRTLKEPCPTPVEMENKLGKADSHEHISVGDCLVWKRTFWKEPDDWKSGDGRWVRIDQEILKACFDGKGSLINIVITRRDPWGDTTVENAARPAGVRKTESN